MSLSTTHTNWLAGSHALDLRYLLKIAENEGLYRNKGTDKESDYLGTKPVGGNLTIGYGYDLVENKSHSVEDLLAVGVALTNAQKNALRNLSTGSSPDDLDSLKLADETAASNLLDLAIRAREDGFQAYLTRNEISLGESREKAVLFSMWYQGQGKLLRDSFQITQALKDDNRPEVWYQIRYGSAKNGGGVIKRRFAESEYFGLYRTGDTASDLAEAQKVYEMFTRHRTTILDYEKKNSAYITSAQGSYTEIHATTGINEIAVELQSSATFLIQEYGRGHNFNPLNIQVGSNNVAVLLGEDTTTRTGSNDDLLIGDSVEPSFLHGFAGKDVLIGGIGNDYLEGGKDDDLLVGGAGMDTYVINTGDGHDTIIDDGRNILVIDGKAFAGVFVKEEGSNS